MDIMMNRTTTIRHRDTPVTDHLFHSVSLVVILTTADPTTTDFEVSKSILSTIEIFGADLFQHEKQHFTWGGGRHL